jgi:phage baseplate assembly protein W
MMVAPFQIDSSGRVAETSEVDTIVRQQILDVLMTSQFERVMRPRYGGSLQRALFEVADPAFFADVAADAIQACNESMRLGRVADIQMTPQYSAIPQSGMSTAVSWVEVLVLYSIVPEQVNREFRFPLDFPLTDESAF